jgi:hypothetical protein
MTQPQPFFPVATMLGEPITVAVRPTRLEVAAARVSLLLRRREARLAVGALSFVIGVGLSLGAHQFLSVVAQYGLHYAMRIYGDGLAAMAAVVGGGAAALVAYVARTGDALSRSELRTGVLLQLGPHGLTATVRGATTYVEWEHVALHKLSTGVAFILPRRTFHLLPYAALRADQVRRLRALVW